MTVVHPVYLPFPEDIVRSHFAPVASAGHPDRHVAYYRESARRAAAFEAQAPTGPAIAVAKAKLAAKQMQKDERFWIATTLMTIFHAPDRQARLVALLTQALGAVPPFDDCRTWTEALGAEPRLYFEVNLPSPPSYKKWLKAHLTERALVAYLRDEAIATHKVSLEGSTKADAVIVAPDTGFAVIFEAKVLADTSSHILYDGARNQIARTIDVLIDYNGRLDPSLTARIPERSCFVLITPQLFKDHPETRLYGWLMREYQRGDDLLRQHLPHREPHQVDGTSRRLGWISWEDCTRVLPGVCPWLD